MPSSKRVERMTSSGPSVQERRQKNLVLILAREFASQLATATFVIDAKGKLVYYNEPAEEILGQSFAEVGEIWADHWTDLFEVEYLDGRRMPLEEMPGGIAFFERKPVHGDVRITALDGVKREISVTAFPLLAREAELVGVVTIFWEKPSL
jgi:PAS domain-containing protein